jgi:tetratricopeptide (TPR) repeat protein
MSDNRIGEAYSRLGRHEEALKAFSAALAIRKELAGESVSFDGRRDLAVAYERVGDEYFILKDPAKAAEMYAQGLPIREALAEADPADHGRLEDLAVAYDRVARTSEAGEALKWVDKSLELRARLVKAEPTNALWQSNYATMLDTKGNMLIASGDCDHALGPLQEGAVIRRSLAERNGDVPQNQANLAISEYHLAICGDQSRQRYANAIEILSKLESAGTLPSAVQGLREAAKSGLDALAER